jgi:hypothetical protein
MGGAPVSAEIRDAFISAGAERTTTSWANQHRSFDVHLEGVRNET